MNKLSILILIFGISIIGIVYAETIPENDSSAALTVTTPNNSSSYWDTHILSGIYVKAPSSQSTRNFISGIYVETNASATDKGRGIKVDNWGSSDSLNLHQIGMGGTGIGITNSGYNSYGIGILNANNASTAIVIIQKMANGAPLTVYGPNGNAVFQIWSDGSLNQASPNGTLYKIQVQNNGSLKTCKSWTC